MANECFKSIFTGFIAGNIIAMMFNQWIFLEMRVNINLVIPLATLSGIAVYCYKPINIQSKLIIVLELLFGILVLMFYNFRPESCFIIPASMIRDGFCISFISLREVNAVLLPVFVIANIFFFNELKMPGARFARQRDEN